MGKVTTWETKCRKCNSRVIHYSTTVDLDITGSSDEANISPIKGFAEKSRFTEEVPESSIMLDKKKYKTSIVYCVCSGENDQGKHELTYKFPDDFQQVK